MYPLLLLLACEPTAPSGDPFAPVPVTPPATPASAPASPDAAEWRLSTELPTVSSEELQRGSAGALQTDLFGNPTGRAASTGPAPTPAAPATPAPASPAAPALLTLLRPTAPLPGDPWPVRLVATLPDAQPPRAILGLASGAEQVVSPGAILPDQGLVVLAVSRDRVQLAKITPAGDHATITSLDLTAQYPAAPAPAAPAARAP